jgi:hypothetical protein
MYDAVPVSRVIPVLPASVCHQIDGGIAGDLPLHVLLADDIMHDMLRSAGHTAATFMQHWRGLMVIHAAMRAPFCTAA